MIQNNDININHRHWLPHTQINIYQLNHSVEWVRVWWSPWFQTCLDLICNEQPETRCLKKEKKNSQKRMTASQDKAVKKSFTPTVPDERCLLLLPKKIYITLSYIWNSQQPLVAPRHHFSGRNGNTSCTICHFPTHLLYLQQSLII